jgi:hypothetical protein
VAHTQISPLPRVAAASSISKAIAVTLRAANASRVLSNRNVPSGAVRSPKLDSVALKPSKSKKNGSSRRPA